MPVNEEIPESRIMLTYRTNVDGEPRDVDLPFRLLVLGDLSLGHSEERRMPPVKDDKAPKPKARGLNERNFRTLDGRNLDAVMKDLDITVPLENVANRIDITAPTRNPLKVTLKLDSMDAFSPSAIAQQVPEIKSLQLLKELLRELQGNLDNRRDFRELIRRLNKLDPAQRQTQLAALLAQLTGAPKSLSVPKRALPAPTPAKV